MFRAQKPRDEQFNQNTEDNAEMVELSEDELEKISGGIGQDSWLQSEYNIRAIAPKGKTDIIKVM